ATPVLRRGTASGRAPCAGRRGGRPLTPELLPEGVEAALGLRRPYPAAGALVARVMARAGARLAAEAGVALGEERMDGDVVRSQVGLDVGPHPVRQGLHPERAALQDLEALGALARVGLIASHARDPALVSPEELRLRLYLVEMAAEVGIALVELPVPRGEGLAEALGALKDQV